MGGKGRDNGVRNQPEGQHQVLFGGVMKTKACLDRYRNQHRQAGGDLHPYCLETLRAPDLQRVAEPKGKLRRIRRQRAGAGNRSSKGIGGEF